MPRLLPHVSSRPTGGGRGCTAPARGAVPPLAWGLLLLAAGAILWAALPGGRGREALPGVWRATTGVAAARKELRSEVRPGGGRAGDLLRLEWPGHPHACEYRVRFRDARGAGPPPVTVQGTVFLYDLGSNALALPGEFTWEVTAVLPDGSEIVTPPRRFPDTD